MTPADQAVSWLWNLYEPAIGRGFVFPLVTRERGGRQLRTTSWFWLDTDGPIHAADLAERTRGGDVWTNAAPLSHRPETGRGGAGDVAGLVALWADIDIAGPGHSPPPGQHLPPDEQTALAALRVFPPPSMTVRTGGGLHLWWCLDAFEAINDLSDRQRLAEISRGWHGAIVGELEGHGFYGDAVGDLARLMRVPGTFNHKRTPPDPVVLVSGADDPKRYHLDDLATLASCLAPKPEPKAPPQRLQRSTLTSEVASPMDCLSLCSWAEILEPAGFQFMRVASDGREEWQRRGATSGAHSLVADPSGAAVVFSSVLAAEWRIEPLDGISKFAAWAAIWHGGDHRRAALAVIEAGRVA